VTLAIAERRTNVSCVTSKGSLVVPEHPRRVRRDGIEVAADGTFERGALAARARVMSSPSASESSTSQGTTRREPPASRGKNPARSASVEDPTHARVAKKAHDRVMRPERAR